MEAISLDTAIAISGKSRRTWWRRIAEGVVRRVADDARGRAMLSWSEVMPYVCIPMTTEDLSFVLRADASDAEAQNDIGQLFSTNDKHEAALYWLQQAAQQENPDAMQWLGSCYLSGKGVLKDDYLAVMWIAKAASHGHVIAKAQMASLWPGGLNSKKTP
jgi:TPR repeat protein